MYSETPYANVKELFEALKEAEAIINNCIQTVDDIWGEEIEADDF